MGPVVATLRKPLAAKVAGVRFFTGVRACVRAQVAALREPFVAALVRAHVGPVAGVRAAVDDQVRFLAERLVAVRKVALILEDCRVGALAHATVEGAQGRQNAGVIQGERSRRLAALNELGVLGLGLHDQHQLVHGRVADDLSRILGLSASVLQNILGIHSCVQRLLAVLLAEGGRGVRGARADARGVHAIGCCRGCGGVRSLGALAASLGGLLGRRGLGARAFFGLSRRFCLWHCCWLGLLGLAVRRIRVRLLRGLVFGVVLRLLRGLGLGLSLSLGLGLRLGVDLRLRLRLLGVRILRVLRKRLRGLGVQLRRCGRVPCCGLGLVLRLWLNLGLVVVVLRCFLRGVLFRLGRRLLGLALRLDLGLSLRLLGRALGGRLGLTLLRLLGLGLLLRSLLLLQLVLVVILLVQLVLRESGRLGRGRLGQARRLRGLRVLCLGLRAGCGLCGGCGLRVGLLGRRRQDIG